MDAPSVASPRAWPRKIVVSLRWPAQRPFRNTSTTASFDKPPTVPRSRAAVPSAIDKMDPVVRGSRLTSSVPRKVSRPAAPAAASIVGAALDTEGVTGWGTRFGSSNATTTIASAAAASPAIRGQRTSVPRRSAVFRPATAASVNSSKRSRSESDCCASSRCSAGDSSPRAKRSSGLSFMTPIRPPANAAAQFADAAAHPGSDGILVESHAPRNLVILQAIHAQGQHVAVARFESRKTIRHDRSLLALEHAVQHARRSVRRFGCADGRHFPLKTGAAPLLANNELQYSIEPREQLIEPPVRRAGVRRLFAEIIGDGRTGLGIFQRAPKRFLCRGL